MRRRHALAALLLASTCAATAEADAPGPVPPAAPTRSAAHRTPGEVQLSIARGGGGDGRVTLLASNHGPRLRARARVQLVADGRPEVAWSCAPPARCVVRERSDRHSVVTLDLRRGAPQRIVGRLTGSGATTVEARIRLPGGSADGDRIRARLERQPPRPEAVLGASSPVRRPGTPWLRILLFAAAAATIAGVAAIRVKRRPRRRPRMTPVASMPAERAPDVPRGAGPVWNLWTLEHAARRRGAAEGDALLFQLRVVAALDGDIPARYDELLEQAFGSPPR